MIKATLESIFSLDMALRSDFNISAEDSERKIRNNLAIVKTLEDKGDKYIESSSSGLLITNDGFIITAFHMIEEYIDEWDTLKEDIPLGEKEIEKWLDKRISNLFYADITGRGKYPLDISTYFYDEDHDIALVKAVIPKKKISPIGFKTSDYDLDIGTPIKLLGYLNGAKCIQLGKVTEINRTSHCGDTDDENIKDTMLTDAYCIDGFSGGPYTNSKGELVGLLLYSIVEEDNTEISGGIPVKYIKKLVSDATYKLKKDLPNLEHLF